MKRYLECRGNFWAYGLSNKRSYFKYFEISNGGRLGVDQGDFNGDIPKAEKFIQDFCSTNEVVDRSDGYGGWGDLTINGKTHETTPYGVDLNMMIEYCGGKPKSFSFEADDKEHLSVSSKT